MYTDTNSNSIGCKLTCTLWEKDACGTTAMASTNVFLGSEPSYEITMKQDVAAGWSTEICVRC